MSFKKILVVATVLFSFGANAIPPIPPATVYNRIKVIAARNCVTENDQLVSDFKDTESVQFVLQLNKSGTAGVLNIVEDGVVIDYLQVVCR